MMRSFVSICDWTMAWGELQEFSFFSIEGRKFRLGILPLFWEVSKSTETRYLKPLQFQLFLS